MICFFFYLASFISIDSSMCVGFTEPFAIPYLQQQSLHFHETEHAFIFFTLNAFVELSRLCEFLYTI